MSTTCIINVYNLFRQTSLTILFWQQEKGNFDETTMTTKHAKIEIVIYQMHQTQIKK